MERSKSEFVKDCLVILCLAVLIFAVIFMRSCSPAMAAEPISFTASYDNYTVPNVSNNYDDGKGFSMGVRHGIWKDIKGQAELTHISDVDFPTPVDVKGSFGELRGYGGLYNILYELRYDKNLAFNLYSGAGCVWWDFRENPYMQDSQITVKVRPSMVLKTGVGMDYKLNKNWKIEGSAGWFDTNIWKEVTNANGDVLNLLDADHNIGLQYFTWRVGIRKKF